MVAFEYLRGLFEENIHKNLKIEIYTIGAEYTQLKLTLAKIMSPNLYGLFAIILFDEKIA